MTPDNTNIEHYFQSLSERVQQSAHVKTVYGEPVETNGKTIIPVARVAFGFGGGPTRQGEHGAIAETAGGGGGVRAYPTGVFEITSEGTKFVRAGHPLREAVLMLIGLGLGWLIGQRSGRS